MSFSTIKKAVEENDTRLGRIVDFSIQVLIIVTLVTFSIETLPDLSTKTRWWLNAIEVFVVIIFTIEYIVRVVVAVPKKQFVFSFFGVVDFLSILPFYLSLGVDLRSLRALRLLRLFRAFKLVRYSLAIQRIHRALLIAKEELVLYFSVTLILLYFSAIGIYYCEHEAQPEKFRSVFESLWWAVTTLTTVGYGDSFPVTVGGKLFTFGILVIGLGIVAVPAGVVSSALSAAREMEE